NVRKMLQTEAPAAAKEPPEALAKHPAVQTLVQRQIDAALKDVANWERVRKFLVLPRPFTVAADELTVSLKLRRNVVFNKYKTELEALYKEGAGITDLE